VADPQKNQTNQGGKRKASSNAVKNGDGRNANTSNSGSGNGGTSRQASNQNRGRRESNLPGRRSNGRFRSSGSPAWITAVIGVGVAVAAGLFATRKQWMPGSNDWSDDYSAAFADDETDAENFDQTRHAGVESMRDHPGDDWEDIDDMSDASFPASDPPSFTPGRA
jgi:hypothetical protein